MRLVRWFALAVALSFALCLTDASAAVFDLPSLLCRVAGAGTVLEVWAADDSVGRHVLRHCPSVRWKGFSPDKNVAQQSRGLVQFTLQSALSVLIKEPTKVDWLVWRHVDSAWTQNQLLSVLRNVKTGVLVLRSAFSSSEVVRKSFEAAAFVVDDVACPKSASKEFACFRKQMPKVKRFDVEPGLQYDAPTFPLVQQKIYTCVAVFMHCGGRANSGGRGIEEARGEEVVAAKAQFQKHTTDSTLLHVYLLNEDDCPRLHWNETVRFRSKKKLGYIHLLNKIRGMVHYFQQVNTCNIIYSLGADIDVNMNWWQLARPKIPMVGYPLYMGFGASGQYAYGSMAAWNKAVSDILLKSLRFAGQFEGSDDIMIGRLLNKRKDLLKMEWAPFVYGFQICLPPEGCHAWIYKHDNARCIAVNRTTMCQKSNGLAWIDPLEQIYRFPFRLDYDS